jgi:hypothetical protein
MLVATVKNNTSTIFSISLAGIAIFIVTGLKVITKLALI